MKAVLFEPSEFADRVGGLELAVRSLEAQLRSVDVEAVVNPPVDDLSSHSPDIVHLNGLWQHPYTRAAAWAVRHDVPYVMSPHGMLEPWAFRHKWWKKWPYFLGVERRLLRGAKAIVATSGLEAVNLEHRTKHENIVVVPLAVSSDKGPAYHEARAHLGWDSEEAVLVYLSRLHPKKGLHLQLEAMRQMDAESLDEVRLVVVGAGDDHYMRRVQRLGREIEERSNCIIEWTGAVWGDEKWAYLQGADLFCLPTHSENFGLVVQEACQVGTPVLTTDATPWGFLADWGAGLIVQPNVGQIKDALQTFLSSFIWSDRHRETLAERTKREFDADRIANRYLTVYRQALEDYVDMAIEAC